MTKSNHLPPSNIVAQWFARPPTDIRPVSRGLSGSAVWRIDDRQETSRRWALRRWPTETREARVCEIAGLVERAKDGGFPYFPELRKTLDGNPIHVTARGTVWECREWLGGISAELPPGEPTRIVGELARASALFTKAMQFESSNDQPFDPANVSAATFRGSIPELVGVADAQPANHPPSPIRSLQRRLRKISFLEQHVPRCIQRWQSLANAHPVFAGDPQMQGLVGLLGRWVDCEAAAAKLAFQHHATEQHPVVRIIGDFHVGNVILNHDKLVGVVDLDAVGWDTPAADIARLLGSIELCWPAVWREASESLWQTTLAAYRELRPFSEQEAALARSLIRWSPGITLGNWLFWLLEEQRQFAVNSDVLRTRIKAWGRILKVRLGTL